MTMPSRETAEKENKELTHKPQNPTKFEFWKGVHDGIIGWYALADSKAAAVITLNGIMMSFVGLGAIVGFEPSEISNEWKMYYLAITSAFVGSIILSVCFAVLGVTKGFDKARDYKDGQFLLTFYADIAHFVTEKRPSVDTVKAFLEGQINNDTFLEGQDKNGIKQEKLFESLAVNITRRSSRLYDKMNLIRWSFYFSIVSIGLLGFIALLLIFYRMNIKP
jgi:hypothetical protein